LTSYLRLIPDIYLISSCNIDNIALYSYLINNKNIQGPLLGMLCIY
jgi:hypothetical protein